MADHNAIPRPFTDRPVERAIADDLQADFPNPGRTRRAYIAPSPLHAIGGIAIVEDVDRPTITRRAEEAVRAGAATDPRQARLVEELLTTVNIVIPGLTFIASQELRRRVAATVMANFAEEDLAAEAKPRRVAPHREEATAAVSAAFRAEGCERSTSDHFAAVAIAALVADRHLT